MIVVHGATMEEHDDRLKLMLQRITDSGIKLNRQKCEFHQTSIMFLEHIVDEDGIRAHPHKVKAIIDMKSMNITELKGMVNFMSKYVPSLSTVMSPLSTLCGHPSTTFI